MGGEPGGRAEEGREVGVRGVVSLLCCKSDEVEGWGEVVVGGEPGGRAEEGREVGARGVMSLLRFAGVMRLGLWCKVVVGGEPGRQVETGQKTRQGRDMMSFLY